MQGRYSYKRPEFAAWKKRYDIGEIDIVPTAPVKPISVAGEQTINGLLDVLILKVDEANSAGRGNSSRAFRLDLDLKLDEKGQVLDGSASAHSYNKEIVFLVPIPKRQVAVSGGYTAGLVGSWRECDIQRRQRLADGTRPISHGQGSGFHRRTGEKPSRRPTRLGCGRPSSPAQGGRSRGGFAMQPYSWTTKGFGGYAAPIIADDKVFVFVHTADMEAIAANPATAKDPFLKLGVEKESLGTVLKHVRDTVYAYDAHTGKRLWAFHGETGA